MTREPRRAEPASPGIAEVPLGRGLLTGQSSDLRNLVPIISAFPIRVHSRSFAVQSPLPVPLPVLPALPVKNMPSEFLVSAVGAAAQRTKRTKKTKRTVPPQVSFFRFQLSSFPLRVPSCPFVVQICLFMLLSVSFVAFSSAPSVPIRENQWFTFLPLFPFAENRDRRMSFRQTGRLRCSSFRLQPVGRLSGRPHECATTNWGKGGDERAPS